MTEPVKHSEVKSIVGRIHVCTRPREAVRHVASQIKGGVKGFLKQPKHKRRYLVAAAIQEHAKNLHEYRYVMGSVPRVYPEFKPRYFFNSETNETTIES